MLEDTICAPATPPISSSIAVIRISGPLTQRAVSSIFSKTGIIEPRYAVYGSIIDEGRILDDVILIYYKSPESFTGEDSAEFFCHGNPIIVNKIIKLLVKFGIRMAEPGEFCKRAFLNGKIDLTEAEAINHIVRARSEWEIDAAINQMHGALRDSIHSLRDGLIRIKADIECGIDFAEEDIEFISGDEALHQLDEVGIELESVLRRCRIGEKMVHGIDVPIVGKPNVGKSSILNLIVNSERAIVSHIPGTTRDLIKETVQFSGMQVNIIDTAGIDIPTSEIEEKGIELSHKKIKDASIVLMVFDLSSGVHETDRKILDKIGDKTKIFIANKVDLVNSAGIKRMEKEIGEKAIPFSAKFGEGLSELEDKMAEIIKNECIEYKNSFISDIRILSILEKSLDLLDSVKSSLRGNQPPEIIALELQSLLDGLSEITGEIMPDDVLNCIFSRFCIGK